MVLNSIRDLSVTSIVAVFSTAMGKISVNGKIVIKKTEKRRDENGRNFLMPFHLGLDFVAF